MSIISGAEAKKQQELKEERKQTLKKFWQYLIRSYKVGIKFGAIILVLVIVAYCIAKYFFKWDLFYETDVRYSGICFKVFVGLLIIMIVCWLGAFILYNTKHTRNTKYK